MSSTRQSERNLFTVVTASALPKGSRILFAEAGSFPPAHERLPERRAHRFPQREIVTFDIRTHIERAAVAASPKRVLPERSLHP